MDEFAWFDSVSAAVTVCDHEGIIIAMNEKANASFANDGGKDLIGKSLMDCHNPHSQQMIREMMISGKVNVYTIEKKGVKKLIYQAPWYKDGSIGGLVEISMEIPFDMPHFVRE
jgi:transcriptional regulator with PAS, ATPase and Fis domain